MSPDERHEFDLLRQEWNGLRREVDDLLTRDRIRDDSMLYALHLVRRLWREETLEPHEVEAIMRIIDQEGSDTP